MGLEIVQARVRRAASFLLTTPDTFVYLLCMFCSGRNPTKARCPKGRAALWRGILASKEARDDYTAEDCPERKNWLACFGVGHICSYRPVHILLRVMRYQKILFIGKLKKGVASGTVSEDLWGGKRFYPLILQETIPCMEIVCPMKPMRRFTVPP